jgi:hypothetical protein
MYGLSCRRLLCSSVCRLAFRLINGSLAIMHWFVYFNAIKVSEASRNLAAFLSLFVMFSYPALVWMPIVEEWGLQF